MRLDNQDRHAGILVVILFSLLLSHQALGQSPRLTVDLQRTITIRYSDDLWPNQVHLVRDETLRSTSGIANDILYLRQEFPHSDIDVFSVKMRQSNADGTLGPLRRVQSQDRRFYRPNSEGEHLAAYFVYGRGTIVPLQQDDNRSTIDVRTITRLNITIPIVVTGPVIAGSERGIDILGLSIQEGIQIFFKESWGDREEHIAVKVHGPFLFREIHYGIVYLVNVPPDSIETRSPPLDGGAPGDPPSTSDSGVSREENPELSIQYWRPTIQLQDENHQPVIGAQVSASEGTITSFEDLEDGTYRAESEVTEDEVAATITILHSDFDNISSDVHFRRLERPTVISLEQRIEPIAVAFRVATADPARTRVVVVEGPGGQAETLYDDPPEDDGSVSFETTATSVTVTIRDEGYENFSHRYEIRNIPSPLTPTLRLFPVDIVVYQATADAEPSRRATVDGIQLFRDGEDSTPIVMTPVDQTHPDMGWTTPPDLGISIEDSPEIQIAGGHCYEDTLRVPLEIPRLGAETGPVSYSVTYNRPVVLAVVAADNQMVNLVGPSYRNYVRRLIEGLLEVFETQAGALNEDAGLGLFEVLLIGEQKDPLILKTLTDCDSNQSGVQWSEQDKRAFADQAIDVGNSLFISIDRILERIDNELQRLPVGPRGAYVFVLSASSEWRLPTNLRAFDKVESLALLAVGEWNDEMTAEVMTDLSSQPNFLSSPESISIETWQIGKILSDPEYLVTFGYVVSDELQRLVARP